jgi:hypothetical protein
MSITRDELVRRVLSGAGLAANSGVAALPTGTGGAATETATVAITRWLNEGQNLMARCGGAASGAATGTLTAGQRTRRLHEFTPSGSADGRVLFAVTGARWGTNALEYTDREVLDLEDREYQAGTVGSEATPRLYAADEGELTVYPVPVADGTVTVRGYFLPAPISASVAFSFLRDEFAEPLADYVIAQLALKNPDDPDLAARYASRLRRFWDSCAGLYAALPRSVREAHFADAPVVTVIGG